MFAGNWRNEATGNWEISLFDDCSIYDCHFWNYKLKDLKRGRIVLTDGKREIAVAMSKVKNGKCRMQMMDAKLQTFSIVSADRLPDYLMKDITQGLKDNGFREGDSIVFSGWLRGKANDGGNLTLRYYELPGGKEKLVQAKTDDMGRFWVKFPIVNTQNFEIENNDISFNTVFEPGETYFLLVDGSKMMFMGNNCRMQNELLSHEVKRPYIVLTADDRTIQETTDYINDFNALVDSVAALHPTLSDRFLQYNCDAALMYMLKEAGMAPLRRMEMRSSFNVIDHFVGRYLNCLPKPQSAFSDAFCHIANIFYNQISMRKGDYFRPVNNMDVFSKMQVTPQEMRQLVWFDSLEHAKARELDTLVRINDINAVCQKYAEMTGEEVHGVLSGVTKRGDNGRIYDGIVERKLAEMTLCATDSFITDHTTRELFAVEMYKESADINPQLPEVFYETLCQRVNTPGIKGMARKIHDNMMAVRNNDFSSMTIVKAKSTPGEYATDEAVLRSYTDAHKGKVVLIDVWATWCGPCVAALSEAQEMYKALAGCDVEYVYFASRSKQADVQRIIDKCNVKGDNVMHYNLSESEQAAIERCLNVNSYPCYRLIDKKGNIIDANSCRGNRQQLQDMIRALAEK